MSNIPYYTYPTRTQISLSIEKTIDREDPYFPIRQNADTCLSSSGYRMMKLYAVLLNFYYDIDGLKCVYFQARFGGKPTNALYRYMYHMSIRNTKLFELMKLIEMSYPYQAERVKKFISDTYGFIPDDKFKGLTCPLHLKNSMTSWSLF